jgi:hypothetical protein
MRVRYKSTKAEAWSDSFNTLALSEILTGDDSCFFKDMDVFVKGEWKDLCQAFKDKDIIPDNYNCYFGEPRNEEERKRGYFL